MEEDVSVASNLEDIKFTVQNYIGSHKLAEPWGLKVDHVGAIVLEQVEKSDVCLGKVHVKVLFVVS